MQRKARIYKPAKTAMQSGSGKTDQWLLEFVSDDKKFVEPLMGWVGSRDTTRQIKLFFGTEAEAIAYAQAHDIPYELKEPKGRKIKPKSYAANFAANLRKYADKSA
jgi:hypothetical protein